MSPSPPHLTWVMACVWLLIVNRQRLHSQGCGSDMSRTPWEGRQLPVLCRPFSLTLGFHPRHGCSCRHLLLLLPVPTHRVVASQTLMVASLLPVQNRRAGSSTCAGSQAMLVMNLRWP